MGSKMGDATVVLLHHVQLTHASEGLGKPNSDIQKPTQVPVPLVISKRLDASSSFPRFDWLICGGRKTPKWVYTLYIQREMDGAF